MKSFLLIAVFTTVCWADGEKCRGELNRCFAGLQFQGQSGLPINIDQIKTLCKTYQQGMECVQSWNKECLPKESRLKIERQMASAQLFMTLLCSDEVFKKEYLNHTRCFGEVSGDWKRCNNIFQSAVKDINSKANSNQAYTQHIIDVCCARYGFNRCISLATKAKCDKSGAVMLRRISETLSHDAKCDRFDTDFCSTANKRHHYNRLTIIFIAIIICIVNTFH